MSNTDDQEQCEKPDNEIEEHSQELATLKKYLHNLAFKPKCPPKEFSSHTTYLARPSPKNNDAYLDDAFRYIQVPKGRRERYKRKGDIARAMPLEQFEDQIKEVRERDEAQTRNRRKRSYEFLRVLDKLEQQCRESAMRDIVDKFANYLADRCVKKNLPTIMTESFQRLTRGLVCNMYISLGICNTIAQPDHAIYETIAYVLADLILEAHFQLQTNALNETEPPPPQDYVAGKKYDCLKQCAERVAMKISHKKISDQISPEFKRYCELHQNI